MDTHRQAWRLATEVTFINCKDNIQKTKIIQLHPSHVEAENFWKNYQQALCDSPENEKIQIVDMRLKEVNPMLKEFNKFFDASCNSEDE